MNVPIKCGVCGEVRSIHEVETRQVDTSEHMGYPPGTWLENLQYCADRMECLKGSLTWKGYGMDPQE